MLAQAEVPDAKVLKMIKRAKGVSEQKISIEEAGRVAYEVQKRISSNSKTTTETN
jgi:hypothetical protein